MNSRTEREESRAMLVSNEVMSRFRQISQGPSCGRNDVASLERSRLVYVPVARAAPGGCR